MKEKLKKKIIAQYEALRRLGQTNMLDKNFVQRLAFENQFYELVAAIQEDYSGLLEKYPEWRKLVSEGELPEAKPLKVNYTVAG